MVVRIHILHCGYVRVDSALPFSSGSLNPYAFTGIGRSLKHQVWLPVSVYLIEHPKGRVLIDTGWHTDVRKSQFRHLGLLHYLINKANLPEGQAIHEQLAKMGLKASDIDYVVLSHLHSDHASGLKHVCDAKKILVSDLEWQEANKHKIRYVPSMWDGVNVETYSFAPSEYGVENQSFDLFGDNSVVFVYSPGHTMGLASTIVQNNGKFVLLCSDVGYAEKSWKDMIMPGVMMNKEKTHASLKWVRNMSKKEECVKVLANHDSGIKPHTIIL